MQIGVSVPNTNAELGGGLVAEWARRAEAAGFSTLSTSDRVAYPSFDMLLCLAAAAAVTDRIGLLTNVLLGPTRSPVLLAKEAATLDNLSGGRFTLGIAVGGREGDFVASGTSFRGRGRRWDDELEQMHQAWSGLTVVEGQHVSRRPVNDGKVPILIGGRIEPAIRRMARWGVGMTMGLAGPDQIKALVPQLQAAWSAAGREGRPRIVGLSHVALGADAEAGSLRHMTSYYGSQFPERAAEMVRVMPRDKASIRIAMQRFEDVGVDELIFSPAHADVDQVNRLAEAVG